MAQQIIDVGVAPNDGQGDPIRTAFEKTNSNFTELYDRSQTTPPVSLIGATGDVPGMYASDSTYFYYCFGTYDGSTIIWAQVTQVGNISTNQITSGNSNVIVTGSGGDVAVGVGGTANVAVFSTDGATVTGNITASGYVLGNGSQLTGLPTTYANSNVQAYGESGWSGNLVPGANATYNLGSPSNQWKSLYVSNTTIYLGNVPLGIGAGNVLTVDGQPVLVNDGSAGISTTGNITGNFFIGNGSQLTGISALGNLIVNGDSSVEIPSASGNISITANGTNTWLFQPDGTTAFPEYAFPFADGTPGQVLSTDGNGALTWNTVGGTGNVTFNDQVVQGTGDISGGGGLYLAPGPDSTGNLQYLRVRAGDFPTHIHFDTGNSVYYDQYLGDDSKYVKLEAGVDGNIVVGTLGSQNYTWTFESSGNLSAPGNVDVSGAVVANNIVTNNIRSDDSTVLSIDDGLNVNGDIESQGNVIVNDTLIFGNLEALGGNPLTATDTTIAFKIPITINGNVYYISLTATQ